MVAHEKWLLLGILAFISLLVFAAIVSGLRLYYGGMATILAFALGRVFWEMRDTR